ncbi:MAG: hypothetical protein QXG86_00735 [Candidatus Woesearchaeota archaeon]
MTEKTLKYIDPNSKSYHEYADHLRVYNHSTQEKLKECLEKEFEKQYNNFTITTTGSDSRLEKGPVSAIEIIIFKEGSENLEDIVSKIDSCIRNASGYRLFQEEYPEIKDIEKDEMYSCTINKGQPNQITIISPNRVFDSSALYGNDNIVKKAKIKLVKELLSEKGKTIFEKIKSRVKEHCDVSSTGVQHYKGKNIQHFDIETGIAFYDPQEKIWSFKQGPLRTIQYAIVRDMIKALRAGIEPDTILTLPSNTVDKLNKLEIEDMTAISEQAIKDLTDNYKYFLWLYHKSQMEYSKGKKEIGFDSQVVKERCESLNKLCSQQIIKTNI